MATSRVSSCLAASVQQAVSILHEGKSKGEKLTELFFAIQKQFSEAVHRIAIEGSVEKFVLFGISRASKEQLASPIDRIPGMTLLNGENEKYNAVVMQQLGSVMEPMQRTLRTFDQKEITKEEEVLGLKSSFSVRVIEGSSIPSRGWTAYPSIEELQSLLKTDKTREDILLDYDLMKRLKETAPLVYEKCVMAFALRSMAVQYPSPRTFPEGSYTGNLANLKSLWALCTLRLEIEGIWHDMSQYLTWLYQDYKTDPVERMVECSKVGIIRLNPFAIDPTLQAISRIFEQAILWTRVETMQELKNRVALLLFTYIHCQPSYKADDMILDCLEQTVYRFHGFQNAFHRAEQLFVAHSIGPVVIASSSDSITGLEPLVSLSLSRYFETYNRTIVIKEE